MKLLVLGAGGMAGHLIAVYLREAGYDVTGLARRELSHCKGIVGDVTDFPFLKNIILSHEYDAVINAVGLLNQYAEADKAAAVLVNSYLPHYLSELTRKLKTRIIHMSTDCVFSGQRGGYRESSPKDGESFYDRSKALGELINDKDLTFRNSIIGPDINENGIGLFHWFMLQKGQVQGYSKVIWSGVTTLTLAKAMDQALKENLTGLYHLVNNNTISKYELLMLFNKYMRKGSMEIKPCSSPVLDKSLINTRSDFSFQVPDYETMVREMGVWIEDHRELYPHYFLRREPVEEA